MIFRPHPFSYDFPTDAEAVRRIQQLLAADAAGPDERTSGAPRPSRSARSSTASTPRTPWSPTSPAWCRTSSSPASRWPWWPCRPNPIGSFPSFRSPAAYVIRGDLTNADRSSTRCWVRIRWRRSERRCEPTTWATSALTTTRQLRGGGHGSLGPGRRSTERTRTEDEGEGKGPVAASTDPRRRLQAIPGWSARSHRRRRRRCCAGGIGRGLASAPAAVWAALVGLTLVLVSPIGRIMLTAPHSARGGTPRRRRTARALLIVTLVLVGASAASGSGSARWWSSCRRRAHLRVPRLNGRMRSITRWSTTCRPSRTEGSRPRRPCWPPATWSRWPSPSWWSRCSSRVAAGGSC